ncbi:starvation-sensing protein RspA [Phytoactinopolyspora alkaliphila]|uniref:Starvation-sensing protein RspA n=1 Tax=Phytoactinopolyspora alkaliphila TaxID=1783498 RepID=A0A6N9YK36_9ACTN|nr:enolase C-terminal domain-like protein [Phytoactinopolyspora alkaliphila]NED95363.1 starvation-sensing protein RspA [Phytoactinopolyspora alkaliphila]
MATADVPPDAPISEQPWPHRDGLRITGISAVVTAPEGHPFVVVRVDTSDDGLYGLGCATFTQRYTAVVSVLEEYIAPMITGRHPGDIDDLTRMIHLSSYWRNGPVLNSALSGIDQALWDIAGKRAGMPVHDLLGGRQRAAATTYQHATAATVEQTIDKARELISGGATHVRLQTGGRGIGHYGAPGARGAHPNSPYPDGWDVHEYLTAVPALFDRARSELGDEVNLMHDVHSRLTVKQAVMLARRLEQYRLFMLEDPIAPEHYDRLPELRASSPLPIAVGEQLSSVTDAARLVVGGGVDLLRLHVSTIGGLSPARRLMALCELLGVQTAWHGPADVSPVGVAANTALSVTTSAFGIQEGHAFPDVVHEIFPGTLRIRDGLIFPNDAPGWGIDVNLGEAAKYPPTRHRHDRWASRVRRPDGGLEAP